jgi:hypothetical protein
MSKLTMQQKKNNSKTSLYYYYYCNNHLSIESSTTRAILCIHTHIFIISVYSLL